LAQNTIVRTNMTAVNAHRQMSGAGITQKRSAQQLASGKRINSAADDAAGLGVAEKMRAQITGLDRASMNAQDGMSLVQTAEGALSSISEMLIRVRELLVQGANDTNVHDPSALMQSDRIAIQDEIDEIMLEINSIAYRTEFNTRALLDGSLSLDGVIRGGNYHTFSDVRINNPAKITTLDQFLRFPANEPFEGSFASLLSRIGANTEGMSANEWIAIHAGNMGGLAAAIDLAMGVDPDITGAGEAGSDTATSTRWQELEISAGLRFSNATEMLDSFVQGLHNPNALRPGNSGGASLAMPFQDWEDFMEHGDHQMGAATFARAVSTAGGLQIYQAFRNHEAFSETFGLSSNSPFSEIRNVFYRMGGMNGSGGWGSEATYSFASHDATFSQWIAHVLNCPDGTPGSGNRTWLETRLGDSFPPGGSPTGGPGSASDTEAWAVFVSRYLEADSEIEQRQVWVANEAERERGIPLWFHIGANDGQGILVGINGVNTRSLGDPFDLADLIDVHNRSGVPISDQIDHIDEALTKVARERSFLGAVYNRLEFSRMNVDVASENLSSAMSRIRDADMARAMMNFTQANILTQSTTSMLAMANQAPEAVLQLLQ